MKVILKGGSPQKNFEIKKFFIDKILPILDFGIAFESSVVEIIVIKKIKGDLRLTEQYIDPTAEVIVELTEWARIMAMNPKIREDKLKLYINEFLDEALAIRALETTKERPFSVEYYSCRHSPEIKPKTLKKECEVHGSIEHVQSATGKCPGCGKH